MLNKKLIANQKARNKRLETELILNFAINKNRFLCCAFQYFEK